MFEIWTIFFELFKGTTYSKTVSQAEISLKYLSCAPQNILVKEEYGGEVRGRETVKGIKAVFLVFVHKTKKKSNPKEKNFRQWLLSLLKDLRKRIANSQVCYLLSLLNTL